MLRLSDLRYAPDQTRLWDAAPGTVYDVTNMVPTPRGTYSTFGASESWGNSGTLAGTASPIIAYMMPLLDGTSRLFVCTAANIDEYDNAGTPARTNRGTGYTATTWSMAQYGNSTIATNGVDAPQVATGAGSNFAALGGTPPDAKIVVVQSNIVLLFNVADGVTTAQDGWNSSGLGNSTSWTAVNILGGASTANLATQANNGRLLQAPGPITAAVAFRDQVVVFKDNAIIVMQYSGNPFGFTSRLVTNQVGTHSMHGVVEHRGKLYFHHTSGFYTFDGSQLQNIGDGTVNTRAYSQLGYGASASAIGDMITTVDDVTCNVFFLRKISGQSYRTRALVFNSANGKWGEVSFLVASERASNNLAVLVKATTYQIVNFKTSAAARRTLWFKWINAGTLLTLQSGGENEISTDGSAMSIAFGSRESAKRIGNVYFDYGAGLSGSVVDPGSSMALEVRGWQQPPPSTASGNINTNVTFTYNSNTLAHNGEVVGKFFNVNISTTAAAAIDAITLDVTGGGRQ